jgi:hypothetical protein
VHRLPWRDSLHAFSQAAPAEQIRAHFGGTVLAWIRLNLPAGVRIASANEFRLYYLSDRKVYRIWDDPELDRALHAARGIRAIVQALRTQQIDYLIFTRADWDNLFAKETLDELERAWASHREAIAFGNENSKLIDLNKLLALLPKP